MTLQDHRRHELTGATPAALAHYETALAELQCYRADPLATIDKALAEAPDFAMAHHFKAYLGILATERPPLQFARDALVAVEGMALTEREAGHRAVVRALCEGAWHKGIALGEKVLTSHPLDVLALQVVHVFNFLVGDARNLRDCVARVRGAWSPEVPGYHAVLGMHAFGLEECGDYARAEREGRRAIELHPEDVWAHHAVTHVFEMQNRVDEGALWMTSREPQWALNNFFAIHHWWHLALFQLERGETDRVFPLYDDRLRGPGPKTVLDLIDASALLWRLFLRRANLGHRPAELAEAWAPLTRDGLYAFNDAHAAMAFAMAEREDLLADLVATMERAATGERELANPAMTREVGLGVVKGLVAFAQGDAARAVEELSVVRPIANRFGGSHAQRDLLDQTLAEAAVRAGQKALALALARERDELKPGHSFARGIRARAMV